MRMREPDSASLRLFWVASLSEKVKPTQIVKQRTSAAIWPSGVVGDSGHRQISQEPGRPVPASPSSTLRGNP